MSQGDAWAGLRPASVVRLRLELEQPLIGETPSNAAVHHTFAMNNAASEFPTATVTLLQ